MKKVVFISLIVVSVFVSCNNKPDYSEEIKGEWLCTEINNLIQPTNEAFVLNFLSNRTESIAQGCTLANNEGNMWCESPDFAYSVNEDEILISGINSLGEMLDISLKIESLTSDRLIYKENYVKINNIDVASDRTFLLRRCSEDYSSEVIGTWQGKKFFSEDSSTNFYFMINYKSDNSFDYYTKVGDFWELSDITGTYFLNGKLLTMNFLDNSISENNHSYECWLIDEVTTNQITCWQYNRMSGSDYNLQGIKYELIKAIE
jgi:hypothetical protein